MAEPTPPQPTTSGTCASDPLALALHAAGEAGTVEHVPDQRSVRPTQDRVAGARDFCGRCHLVHQAGRSSPCAASSPGHHAR